MTMLPLQRVLSCLVFLIVLLGSFNGTAQQIQGIYSLRPHQQIQLLGFRGLEPYLIDSTRSDGLGHFVLHFSPQDHGIGQLVVGKDQPFLIVLEQENFHFTADAPLVLKSMQIEAGQGNRALLRYALEQPRRDRALGAWNFLFQLYLEDSLYRLQENSIQAIEKEISRIEEEERMFIQSLPADNYVKWYLPLRKLVTGVSRVAQFEAHKIPATRAALRAIDYQDPRLNKSGLLREAIDNHVWFIENSSESLDSVYAKLNRSIDIMYLQLIDDESQFELVFDYLFNLLESRSLFASAEYLALKLLNDQSCTLHDDLSFQLEGYRRMKLGNQAPDISFTEYTYRAEGVTANALSEVKAAYKVVVFAAGWCGHCTDEIPQLAMYYADWKKKDVEIILISLDETTSSFVQFVGPFPFTSTTDLRKWESKAVQDYHVFATPTFYLLDQDMRIILKPGSIEQLRAWIDWHLGQ